MKNLIFIFIFLTVAQLSFGESFSPEPRMSVLQRKLSSQLCTSSQMNNDTYKYWCAAIRENPRFHRKQWEFVYILQALDERGMLSPGKKGLDLESVMNPCQQLWLLLG